MLWVRAWSSSLGTFSLTRLARPHGRAQLFDARGNSLRDPWDGSRAIAFAIEGSAGREEDCVVVLSSSLILTTWSALECVGLV